MSNVGKIVIIGTSFPYIYKIASETPKGFKGYQWERGYSGRPGHWNTHLRQVTLDRRYGAKPYGIVDSIDEALAIIGRISEIDKEARAYDEKARAARDERRFYQRQIAVLKGEPEFGIKADERDLANG